MDGLFFLIVVDIIEKILICFVCVQKEVFEFYCVVFYGKEWIDYVNIFYKDEVNVGFVKEFDWVVLCIGLFYVEMNMVKIFFVVNWEVFFSSLVRELGFIFDSVLSYVKGVKNYYCLMIMLNILEWGNWCELFILYVCDRMVNYMEIFVNDYLYEWMFNVKCSNYLYLFE